MTIVYEPHTCRVPPGRHHPSGTVWQCDECPRRWVRNGNHPDNVYPLWRRRFRFGKWRTNMSRDEVDEQTGGLHPAEICGEDCSGCCDETEG